MKYTLSKRIYSILQLKFWDKFRQNDKSITHFVINGVIFKKYKLHESGAYTPF